MENPHYKVLLDHAAFLQGTATEKRTQIIHLTEEIEGLKTSRKEWEEGIIVRLSLACAYPRYLKRVYAVCHKSSYAGVENNVNKTRCR